MLAFLDTNIIVYAIEGAPAFRQRAHNHLASLEQQGFQLVASEFLRSECLVGPLRTANAGLHYEYCRFFSSGAINLVALSDAVYERASWLRAGTFYPAAPGAAPRRLHLYDAIHIATAIEARCSRFVTNDLRLSNVAQIAIDVLP